MMNKNNEPNKNSGTIYMHKTYNLYKLKKNLIKLHKKLLISQITTKTVNNKHNINS